MKNEDGKTKNGDGDRPSEGVFIIHPSSFIILSLAAFALFGGIAWGVQAQNAALIHLDTALLTALHDHASASPTLLAFFQIVSTWGNPRPAVVIAAVVGLELFLRRRFCLGAAWVIAVLTGGMLNEGLKHLFQRPRPTISASWSFPSGHATGTTILFGLLAYLLVGSLPRRWQRCAVVLFFSLVILAIGFSRLYLGVHYLSDVVGGFAFGAGWVALWIALIEAMKWRKVRGQGSGVRGQKRPDEY